MVFTLRPSAHLGFLATGHRLGTISRSSGIGRFVQGGVVKTFRYVPQAKMKAKLSQLNDAERDWLAGNLSATQALIAELGGDSDVTPSTLDSAFDAWLAQHDAETEDPNPIINALGSAFGQYLVDHLGLNWVVAADKHGTEMAVHGQPGDILVYPANLVAKRYTIRETAFFVPLFNEFRTQIETLRSQPPTRPWWKFW